jgi:hypothetical protein
MMQTLAFDDQFLCAKMHTRSIKNAVWPQQVVNPLTEEQKLRVRISPARSGGRHVLFHDFDRGGRHASTEGARRCPHIMSRAEQIDISPTLRRAQQFINDARTEPRTGSLATARRSAKAVRLFQSPCLVSLSLIKMTPEGIESSATKNRESREKVFETSNDLRSIHSMSVN